MDLLRRNSARRVIRVGRTRLAGTGSQGASEPLPPVGAQRLESEESAWLGLLDAYTEGVNAGLRALNKPPFEYLLLGARQRGAPRIRCW